MLFFPSQPEIALNTYDYTEFQPPRGSRNKDITLFYQFRTKESAAEAIPVIPDGCIDCIFCCEPAHPDAVLWTSPYVRKIQPDFKKESVYFGVRFIPEQTTLQLKTPMHEIIDQNFPAESVAANFDTALLDQLLECNSFCERVKLFQRFFVNLTSKQKYDHKIIQYCSRRIYASNGTVTVRQLSEETGYSDRYVRNKFAEYIGFSPKQFCRIVKFQNSVHKITRDKHISQDLFLEIIQENGYYDHAHFNRDFKRLAGVTPTQFKRFLGRGKLEAADGML
ncbi:helix-turn-helix domain-containing protein [Evansella sp. LMS18]|jgi:AraC-like DNA-binding protein|uniref:helix-turn-helix domain-containing protein n=1 Tax=Evansella sp. LMS18 TaxID=2924033 RepID=UPI0020D1989F|nr:helix-turn-helix domain-containing protein [Evansella sp. LMS18]UTR10421.1 helix-turn-helix domain-containing protein [Evansella sp. LMS18]